MACHVSAAKIIQVSSGVKSYVPLAGLISAQLVMFSNSRIDPNFGAGHGSACCTTAEVASMPKDCGVMLTCASTDIPKSTLSSNTTTTKNDVCRIRNLGQNSMVGEVADARENENIRVEQAFSAQKPRLSSCKVMQPKRVLPCRKRPRLMRHNAFSRRLPPF